MTYIINADDFGRTETVNKAIAYGFDNQYLDRTTVMVNMPFFEQAVKIAKSHGFVEKVGLHINLTSGFPLTKTIRGVDSFCDKDGSFNGQIFSNKRMMLFLTNTEREAAKEEICAQIEKFFEHGFSLRHADSHGHVHTFPSMQGVVLGSLDSYSFNSVRISANLHEGVFTFVVKLMLNYKLIRYNLKRGRNCIAFDSFKVVEAKKTYMNHLTGDCEVMIHPNIWDGDMQIGQGLHYKDLKLLR